jgi:hypothetical protein
MKNGCHRTHIPSVVVPEMTSTSLPAIFRQLFVNVAARGSLGRRCERVGPRVRMNRRGEGIE